MKLINFLLFFVLLILLVRPVFANAGESESYSINNIYEGLATGASSSESYTFDFIIPYGQNTESGGYSGSYYFGNYEGGIEIIIEDDSTPYSGSGSGGGGVRTEKIAEIRFNVSPTTLRYFLKEGSERSKEIIIENQGDEEIIVNLIETSGFIGLESKSLTIGPGKTKRLLILVSAMNEKEGIYTSKIILSSGNVQKEVILLIEIEKAQSDLDLLVDVIEEDKIIVNKGNISSNLIIYDLTGKKNMNVTFEYFIQDLNGNVIAMEKEDRFIDSGNSFTKTINLINNLEEGDYVFSVKASFEGKSVFSGSLFKVVSSEEEKQILLGQKKGNYDLIIKLGVFVLLLVFILIVYESEKINLVIGLCEFNVRHNDFYHAKINYNKLVKMFKKHVFKKEQKEQIEEEIQELHKYILRKEKQ